MRKKALILTCIILSIILIGCTNYELVGKAEAVVINKEYKDRHSMITMTPVFNGKTTTLIPMTIMHPEKHNVKLQHKDLTIVVNDKELYDSINIGENIEVNLYKSDEKEKIVYEK